MDYPNLLLPLLEQPTLLILGAGASVPYGFPSGNQLKNEIFSSLQGKLSPILYQDFGYDNQFIEDFKDALRFTSHPTIDIFLEHKNKYRDIGSYAIAYTILRKEAHNSLFPKKDWYGVIYDLLSLNNPIYDLSNLSIVTLNYERSLEYFLTNNIKYDCHDELEAKASEAIKNIQIIHAHGSLGNFNDTPFGISPSKHSQLAIASKSIKIVSDKLESSSLFKIAQAIIKKSKNIIILGLGYDFQTLEKLFLDINFDDKTVRGTSMGIDGVKGKKIIEFFQNKITLDEFKYGCDVFLNSQFRIVKQ